MQKNALLVATLFVFAMSLAGCSLIPVYKPDIQQGNVFSPEMVARLRPGMTETQVHFIMGTPVLVNTFNPHRWDYVYTFKTRSKPQVLKHVTVTFFNGRVTGVR